MRNGNYCAFYVAEPFNSSSLGAHATKDFTYYNLLRSWKATDPSIPFIDSHDKTYNVRDGSDWESALKPRLRQRLSLSKNILLFLSTTTLNSQALREEIDYGVKTQKLPVIVIYPDYNSSASMLAGRKLNEGVRSLWSKLPIFRDSMSQVPTLHVPMNKELIVRSLRNNEFTLGSGKKADIYRYDA